jgi:hypothetical protein
VSKKTTTTTYEYDDRGFVTKEVTVVEVENTKVLKAPADVLPPIRPTVFPTPGNPYPYPQPRQPAGWWQQPVTSIDCVQGKIPVQYHLYNGGKSLAEAINKSRAAHPAGGYL